MQRYPWRHSVLALCSEETVRAPYEKIKFKNKTAPTSITTLMGTFQLILILSHERLFVYRYLIDFLIFCSYLCNGLYQACNSLNI